MTEQNPSGRRWDEIALACAALAVLANLVLATLIAP